MKTHSKLIENIFNIDENIDNSLFKTKFKNSKIEEIFNKFISKIKSEKSLFICINLAFLIGHCLNASNIYEDEKNNETNRIITILGVCLDIMIFFIFFFSNNKKINYYSVYFKFILYFSISIFSMGIFSEIKNKTDEIFLLRKFYYFILINNLGYIVFLDDSLVLIIFFCFSNFSVLIYLLISYNTKYIGLNEALYCIIFSSFSYLIKRNRENVFRKIFIKKYKFEKFYEYCNDLISGMNGYHLCFFENSLVYMNKNFINFLKPKNIGNKKIKKDFKLKKSSHTIFYDTEIKEFADLAEEFLINLKPLQLKIEFSEFSKSENIKEILKTKQMQNKIQESKRKNSFDFRDYSKFDNNLQDNLDNSSYNINVINNSSGIGVNNRNSNKIYSDLNESHKNSFNDKKIKEKYSANRNNKEKENFFQNKVKENFFKNKSEENNNLSTDDETKFILLGQFVLENLKEKQFYEVFIRTNKKKIIDFLIYEITDQKKAENSHNQNQLKQKFLAKIAHEFKTPINSIIGLINEVRESISIKDLEATNEYLNIISDLSNYTIYLINDVIQYATQNEIKDIKINLETVYLKDIILFCFNILKTLLKCNDSKNICIKPILDLDPDIEYISVRSDEIRLRQIILNFISNSVKFTKYGNIKLSTKLSSSKDFVEISVEDTGIGIKDDDIKRIFNENTMVEASQNINRLGSGLGLSICYNLSKRLNHDILVQSKHNKGSLFTLKIRAKYVKKSNSNTVDRKKENYLEFKISLNNIKKNNTAQNPKNNTFREHQNQDVSLINLEGFNSINANIKNNNKFNNITNINFYNNLDDNKSTSRVSHIDFSRNNLNETYKNLFNIPILNNLINKNNYFVKNFNSNNLNSSYSCYDSDLNSPPKNPPRVNNNILDYMENNEKNLLKTKTFLSLTPLSIKKISLFKKDSFFPTDDSLNGNFNVKNNNKNDLTTYRNTNRGIKLKYSGKILIVDDNQFLRISLKNVLNKIMIETRIYYEIFEGNDGVDILKYIIDDQFLQNQIKCIFTDENMDYINGSEAIRIVRNLEKENKIKNVSIISITSYEDDVSKDNIKKCGVDSIVSKPYTKSQLLTALRKVNIFPEI